MRKSSEKIVDFDAIASLLAPERSSGATVALCHGVFDVVHPGHLSHISFAKSKCEILVVSLTGDRYVNKGPDRPHVLADVRARSIAALEVVDYVVINEDFNAVELIKSLKPEFFAKGFEYRQESLIPRIQAELDALSSYGGLIIYSPDDVIYSSTKLLAMERPNVVAAEFERLTERYGITIEALHEIISSLSDLRVHVVGDVIIDELILCSAMGQSAWSPTLTTRFIDKKLFLGGAGIVAKHLRSLGASVTLTTVTGDDGLRKYIEADLTSAGIETHFLEIPGRKTSVKQRFWSDGHKLLQLENLDTSPLEPDQVNEIADQISNESVDVVILSDFRHGIFHSDSISTLIEAIPEGALKVADTKVNTRWGSILDFIGFDLITPNQIEARFALNDQDSDIYDIGSRLFRLSNAKNMILKLSANGAMALQASDTERLLEARLTSYVFGRVIDTMGSGDAMLAVSSLVLAATGDIVKACLLGSIAAALECEIEGNVAISPLSISARIEQLRSYVG